MLILLILISLFLKKTFGLLVLSSKLKLFIFKKIFNSSRFIFKYLSLSEISATLFIKDIRFKSKNEKIRLEMYIDGDFTLTKTLYFKSKNKDDRIIYN